MKDNIAMEKSEDFALLIINLFEDYTKYKRAPYVLLNQLLRSGTSIGANLSEAVCAYSKNDFHSKISISLKECSETRYWLRLLYKSNYLPKESFENLYKKAEEIFKILTATTKTLAGNN